MDAFMGTIMAVGFNYPPRGWAFCNGQLLSISQNTALFSLLGTTYGGDGQQTFGLPDLRGRVVVGSQAYGPGITPIQPGEKAGVNNVTVIGNGAVSISLTSANLPPHTHPASMDATGLTATTTVNVDTTAHAAPPAVTAFAAGSTLTSTTTGSGSAAAIFLPSATPQTAPAALGGVTTTVSGNGTVSVGPNTGGGQALAAPVQTQALTSVMQPYTGVNYIIALEGIFPSRN